ncbi:PREDICTED: uncharacterized protein LOC105959659 [Erythranthe guttata]|uniref:uncharacterized protein LOC105959659 n=1 Tax=Erythranthe guttata TaxID=4155 RepID=UPI00064DBB2D|nr:PREDICTED: uncharacterized protein LOC105959659 [Erythranthe guttata]|eukprot:XP_012839253.1 PREDICTED: uncharacterized protein LOC105959659 [Erythranthe guttata]
MTYRLEGIGECILADDDDMMSMFEMLSDLSLDCIDVNIDGKPVGLPGPNVLSAEVGGFLLVLYDECVVVNERNVEGVADKVKGRRLLSADWAYLIKDVGQGLEGGVREFRKSLIKYSIEMGFEFLYVKNETTRVTAVCRFKNASQSGKTNPGSIFHLDVEVEKQIFRRCFFAFAVCLDGFKFCRPVVMLDDTFLKGRYKGVLLSEVGKDVNEGLFPIAFAIVSEETDSNWAWFLGHFRDAIGNDRTLNFVSDRNHGIIEGVRNIFPDCLHTYSYKHLQNNLKYRFRGVPAGFRETVLQQFAAYDLLKEKWSNVYCEGHRYGQMTSNGCESWNHQIKKQRYLPITSLIDGIRWTTVLCEKTEKRLKEAVDKGRSWICKRSSMHVFEVFSSPNAVVDLGERTCSCRLWYHRSTFKESYSSLIIPFVRQVSDLHVVVIGPPEVKPTRGRPKRKKIPSQGECVPRKMTCSRCKAQGNHNKNTCRK